MPNSKSKVWNPIILKSKWWWPVWQPVAVAEEGNNPVSVIRHHPRRGWPYLYPNKDCSSLTFLITTQFKKPLGSSLARHKGKTNGGGLSVLSRERREEDQLQEEEFRGEDDDDEEEEVTTNISEEEKEKLVKEITQKILQEYNLL